MKKLLLCATVLLLFCGTRGANAQKDKATFTIYLVRHAEKDLASKNNIDPPLTSCGTQRSEYLNQFFKAVPISAVYSTDYRRTRNTATPTALAKELKLQVYNAADLEAFSNSLLEKKEDALVVGHSDTTGVLAGLLIGEEKEAFDLDIYNRIYQVVVYNKSGRIHLFHTAFECNK